MAHDHCASFRENIAAYALGALDAEEAAALEAHLRICDSGCRDELAAYQAVGTALLTALPPQQPPAALRRRLLERLPAPRKSRPSWPAWNPAQFALGLALVLLVVLNTLSLLQIQALQSQQAQVAHQVQTGQAAFAMLAYPDTKSLPIIGSDPRIAGTLLLDREHNAGVLIVWNLPPIDDNHSYQIWLVDPKGDRTSAGLFRPEPGQPITSQAIFSLQQLGDFTGLGVTLEPAGGSPKPTGQRILTVKF